MSIKRKLKQLCKKIKNTFKIANDKSNIINVDAEIIGNIKIKIGGVNNTIILKNIRVGQENEYNI